MDYVVAVQAPAYPLEDGSFATESAFAEHLKELRTRVGGRFTRLVLLAPRMPEAQYQASRTHLGTLDPKRDGVHLVALHPSDASVKEFWRDHLRADKRQIDLALANAGVVQSGLSDDTYRPFMALINTAAWWKKVPVVFIVDIDFRRHTERNYALGVWGKKSYVVNKLLHDPLRKLQVTLAPRMFQLVLLKSASMVRDFGHGRANVKNFYDTVHRPSDILSDSELTARVAFLDDATRPLTFVYFGRFVPYKGLDRAVEALALARAEGADVRLKLIGSGECLDALQKQVATLGLTEAVTFEGQVRYGAELFERLRHCHVALNTPLREDTPRSAFDAMARGLPILAFDIGYFRDLAGESEAVALAAWPEPKALAEQMLALARERGRVAQMARRAVQFARQNTQAEWIDRRTRWVLELATPAVAALASAAAVISKAS